jgi:hypothetical protein
MIHAGAMGRLPRPYRRSCGQHPRCSRRRRQDRSRSAGRRTHPRRTASIRAPRHRPRPDRPRAVRPCPQMARHDPPQPPDGDSHNPDRTGKPVATHPGGRCRGTQPMAKRSAPSPFLAGFRPAARCSNDGITTNGIYGSLPRIEARSGIHATGLTSGSRNHRRYNSCPHNRSNPVREAGHELSAGKERTR